MDREKVPLRTGGCKPSKQKQKEVFRDGKKYKLRHGKEKGDLAYEQKRGGRYARGGG